MEKAKQLLLEFRQSRNYLEFTHRVSVSKGLIQDLINLSKSKEYPFPEYASWLLTHFSYYYPKQLAPFLKDLIDILFISQNHSVLRNTTSTLLQFDLIPYREGELLDLQFQFLISHETKVAHKAYCMQLICRFLKKFPDLKNEFVSILQERIPFESPAYSAAARKSLKEIEKLKNV
jgi:hypothetical protein